MSATLAGLTLPPTRRPNLLGIGAAKAGTTWLAGLLAAHPDIFMPPQKELNALHYGNLAARLHEYQAYFDAGETHAVRCDFSVRYLASPQAPAAAAQLAPDSRILAILRNPVDQLQSHYWHLRRQNFHHHAPVDPAPDLFQALDRFGDILLEPALYGKHLTRWLEHFPRERLLVLDHADLAGERLGPSLERLCRFLEIESFDFSAAAAEASAAESRVGVQPRGGLAGFLYSRLYVGVARGPYQWAKQTFGVKAMDSVKRGLKLRQASEAVFFKPGYPRLDATDRARLYERMAPDIAQLESLGLIDTSRWKPAP
ncbi:hypothetical protein QO010_000866 [Caulobacter ginsengisoli]|uniref:Sulfotransferase domain-containing protein n=1 Tax=Caulobacter ginsengisoli TaxID=400775 RepID=A0ABU0IM67_9CAUL|nr:sulfotransferase domain-containing protein [Caulobacter ginsengisoli]MDQ0463118.1 hypothetical protein [Caulobacter ginsengisoli]